MPAAGKNVAAGRAPALSAARVPAADPPRRHRFLLRSAPRRRCRQGGPAASDTWLSLFARARRRQPLTAVTCGETGRRYGEITRWLSTVATPGAEEAAALPLVMMLGGTLPVPLYVFYEKQMGFGPLGVTVVFAAYIAGTLFALVVLGDLSDHIGRKKVLAIAVACAAVSTALFLAASGLAASGIGVLIVARVVSGMAAGLATGTATAALTELQPRGDHRAAAVTVSGSNMTGLGLGPLLAGRFAERLGRATRT